MLRYDLLHRVMYRALWKCGTTLRQLIETFRNASAPMHSEAP
jgi:hypothetical protein